MKLIIASNNEGKIREYKQMLGEAGFDEVLSLKQAGIVCEPEETGETFEENAAIKARALHEMCGCGAIADDSGLAVDALDGQPGVYSARWLGLRSDSEKNAEILKRLEGLPPEKRTARFICVIHLVYPDGKEVCARGVCEGRIAYKPQGNDGFGYDPIFLYGSENISFAEMSAKQKNEVSHRGMALKELTAKLKSTEINFCV